MTPFEIDILLHYYTRPGDPSACVDNVPLWRPTLNMLMACDLLTVTESNGSTYRLTERGRYYVAHGICKVPVPVTTFTIPWGER